MGGQESRSRVRKDKYILNSTLVDKSRLASKIHLMEFELHPVQADILLVLTLNPTAKFVEMNTSGMSLDHFNFHVQRLVKTDLIRKTRSGRYRLTTKGKQLADRIEADSVVIEKQPKVSVLVICIMRKNNTDMYLMQKRLKHPYYGYLGMITGKVRWGETLKEAAARELKEETGLSGKMTLVGVEHKLDYSKREKLLADKLFFVFTVTDVKGRLQNKFKEGENMWMKEKDILTAKNIFEDIPKLLEIIKGKSFAFFEKKFKVQNY